MSTAMRIHQVEGINSALSYSYLYFIDTMHELHVGPSSERVYLIKDELITGTNVKSKSS